MLIFKSLSSFSFQSKGSNSESYNQAGILLARSSNLPRDRPLSPLTFFFSGACTVEEGMLMLDDFFKQLDFLNFCLGNNFILISRS